MSRQFSDYTGQFFWDFKKMDNVNYNFKILEALYLAKKQNNSPLFNKPIIVVAMAIIECSLYDFLCRIHGRVSDSLPNIDAATLAYLENSNQTDELRKIIPIIECQNLLRVPAGDNIYGDLEHLRVVRNRIHIQNRFNSLVADESDIFTDINLHKVERCIERVCGVLCNVYPRWSKMPLPMKDFPRPWI